MNIINKNLGILLIVIGLIGLTVLYAFNSFNAVETCSLVGDVNLDGSVTSTDKELVLESVVGITKLTEAQKLCADMNNNGVIDTGDATLIQRILDSS